MKNKYLILLICLYFVLSMVFVSSCNSKNNEDNNNDNPSSEVDITEESFINALTIEGNYQVNINVTTKNDYYTLSDSYSISKCIIDSKNAFKVIYNYYTLNEINDTNKEFKTLHEGALYFYNDEVGYLKDENIKWVYSIVNNLSEDHTINLNNLSEQKINGNSLSAKISGSSFGGSFNEGSIVMSLDNSQKLSSIVLKYVSNNSNKMEIKLAFNYNTGSFTIPKN